MDATHLNKLLQGPSLALSMRLGQETSDSTARKVEGLNAAREGQVREGFDVGECGEGTIHFQVSAAY
jgi:hypothetical protein